jgi:hypothetical protein
MLSIGGQVPTCYSRNFFFFPFPFYARLANICRTILSASFSHPRKSRFVPGYPVYLLLSWRFPPAGIGEDLGTPEDQAANRVSPLNPPSPIFALLPSSLCLSFSA